MQEWPKKRIFSYAVGHVMNDMCASTWFSYLLIFLHQAVGFTPKESAVVMFSGQIADGLATPLAGVVSDMSNGFCNLGRRSSWLAVGALLVVVCYYMVFGYNFLHWVDGIPSEMAAVVYYSVGAALFNAGWATVQVAHMSLVPELSNDDNVRCMLNSYRYAFTIVSNVVVFGVFFGLLQTVQPYNVPDRNKFSLMADFILITGTCTVLIFLMGTKESKDHPLSLNDVEEDGLENPLMNEVQRRPIGLSWQAWFKIPMFYEVGWIYMCTRLVINITQVYLPFYLLTSLEMSATSIAIVPLIVYLAGFISTFCMQWLNRNLGRRWTYIAGGLLDIFILAGLYVLPKCHCVLAYALAVGLGIGNSIIMITSINMEGDLVRMTSSGSAFVYGAMSFTDKVSNGIAIVIIQQYRQNITDEHGCDSPEDAAFSRLAFAGVPVISMILGMMMVAYIRCPSTRTNTNVACYGTAGTLK